MPESESRDSRTLINQVLTGLECAGSRKLPQEPQNDKIEKGRLRLDRRGRVISVIGWGPILWAPSCAGIRLDYTVTVNRTDQAHLPAPRSPLYLDRAGNRNCKSRRIRALSRRETRKGTSVRVRSLGRTTDDEDEADEEDRHKGVQHGAVAVQVERAAGRGEMCLVGSTR